MRITVSNSVGKTKLNYDDICYLILAEERCEKKILMNFWIRGHLECRL